MTHLSAQTLLKLQGLKDEVIDQVLRLHAMEMADAQREHLGAHGLIYTGTVGEVIDVIDPRSVREGS